MDNAFVVELVDTLVLGTSLRVGVRVPPDAPTIYCPSDGIGIRA